MAELFRTHWPTSAAVYLPNNMVPPTGTLFTNQTLAATYLRILKEAGLIIGEIERPRVCYSLNPAALKPLAAFLDRATAGSPANERA